MSATRQLMDQMAKGNDSELLIISLDVGTTQSGAALAYVGPEASQNREPAVLEKLPGQIPGKAKVPSVLLYDADGKLQDKWGFQLAKNSLSREEKATLKDGKLRICEWFKLHIDPAKQLKESAFINNPTRQLPPGKTGFEVWGDFLGRLGHAAKEAAREEWAISWIPELERKEKLRFIVSIPVAWQNDPATMIELRKQAVRVGLVSPETKSCLRFCSESEASALHCYEQTKHINLQPGEVFLVVDAGGGTVDFTSYKVTKSEPLEMEEVSRDSKICLYSGSTFVDSTFRVVLEEYLEQTYPTTTVTEKHLQRAMDTFIMTKKPDFSMLSKTAGFWEVSDSDDDYEDGGIEIPWSLIESAFKPHIDLIIESVSLIARRDTIKYLFCTGGFGDSPYLRQRLELAAGKTVQVIQPEQTSSSSGSKAVSLGAVCSGLTCWLKARINYNCIGIRAARPATEAEIKDPALQHRLERRWGEIGIMIEYFKPIIKPNDRVAVNDYREVHLTQETDAEPAQTKNEEFCLFTASGPTIPQWADEAGGSRMLGRFHYRFLQSSLWYVKKSPNGTAIRRYPVTFRVYVGEAELRAEVFDAVRMRLGEYFLELD